mmetsp:Transcript_12659/g.54213  ORF Transcript_12659/g.54213 Transcript_12659/m.54213 type:complete len:557 (-) Transcript_12659:79-1749(-)
MNERTRERELAERRALALKKLAKVFGTNGGDTDDGRAAHTAEKKILLEILRSTREPDVVGLVRDRLAVLSARDDSDESDEDYDVKAGEPGAGYDRRNPKPADPRDAKTVFSKQWTAAALREIAKGARDVPPATLASGAFWEKLLVTHAPELEHLRCDSKRQRESNGDEPEDDDDDGDGDDDDDDSFRSDGVEQEEESEGERGAASPRASGDSPTPEALSRAPPESTASLLKRHELIRREFGKETSPDPPERSSAFFDDEKNALDPTEREMARVFAGDGDAPDGDALDGDFRDARSANASPGTRRKDAIPGMTSSVPTALRFAPPPEPEPSRNLTLWPTPFGRPANDVPNRAVREDVGISYPVPPVEERNLPKYSQRNEGRKKGLASLAFARSVGTGTVGAAGFAGVSSGHAPDPRALRLNEGVETLGLGPLPPGFLASKEIQQLAETLAKKGDYEGGGGRVDRDIAAGRGGGDEAFRKRVSAAKRAVTSNVEAGLDGRSPAGGTLVDLVPEEDAEASAREDNPHTANEGPATRAPVTSGSQTMSLNAHARSFGVYD